MTEFRLQVVPSSARRCSSLSTSVIQALHGLLCLLGQWPQHCVLISPLAFVCVEVVLVNIFYHRVGDQVFHTEVPSQSSAHLCGTDLILNPFPHQENVLSVAREHVRLVHGPVRLQPPSADADEAETPDYLLHVVVPPQAGDLESLEEICST